LTKNISQYKRASMNRPNTSLLLSIVIVSFALPALGATPQQTGRKAPVLERECVNAVFQWFDTNLSRAERLAKTREVCQYRPNPLLIADCLTGVYNWSEIDASSDSRYNTAFAACRHIQVQADYAGCMTWAWGREATAPSRDAQRLAAARRCARIEYGGFAQSGLAQGGLVQGLPGSLQPVGGVPGIPPLNSGIDPLTGAPVLGTAPVLGADPFAGVPTLPAGDGQLVVLGTGQLPGGIPATEPQPLGGISPVIGSPLNGTAVGLPTYPVLGEPQPLGGAQMIQTVQMTPGPEVPKSCTYISSMDAYVCPVSAFAMPVIPPAPLPLPGQQ
jgi:hypothetical protein